MSIIAKYKFDKTIYADLLPEFNSEFTSDLYTVTDVIDGNVTTRTIESDSLPTLMRFGAVESSVATERSKSLLEIISLDISNCTHLYHYFRCCINLTTVNGLIVHSGITNLDNTFGNCNSLESVDTSDWNTSNVTHIQNMFCDCHNLITLDVSNFDTSKVTDMNGMFGRCYKVSELDVSNFDTNNVTTMISTFQDCNNLTSLDVSNWDTSNVTNMICMFYNCNNLTTLDVSNFDTSKVTNMGSLFAYCNNLTSLDVSNFDTSKVTDMQNMFSHCTNLVSLDVSNWDTSNVTSMYNMFNGCANLTSIDVSNLNTSNVTNMGYMFYCCTNLTTLDVSNFDTSNVTNMQNMFYYCTNLTTLDVSNFDTSKVTNMNGIFDRANNLKYVKCNNVTTLNTLNTYLPTRASDNQGAIICKSDTTNLDTTTLQSKYWTVDTSDGTMIAKYKFDKSICNSLIPEFNRGFSGYFCNDVVESNIVTREIVGYGGLPTKIRFSTCEPNGVGLDGREKALLELLYINNSALTSEAQMFQSCINLTYVNTENMINLHQTNHMFCDCTKLTTLDVSNFDTSNVTNMNYMFAFCTNLISLDVSNFDTSNVTTMEYMFYDTPLLADIGMLYCDQSTINKITSSLPTNTTQTVWVEDVDIKDLTPVEGVEFKQYAKNTEIMLTSPLLEGDKLIVKDGQLCHYHKMGKVVLDGSEDWIHNSFQPYGYFYADHKPDTKNIYCNKIKPGLLYDGIFTGEVGIGIGYSSVGVSDLVGLKAWLQVNQPVVVYELAEPYYELISEDPLDISLIAESSDITSSSNIPLNMTINNKGLSTVAMSPSTTYTVAFDKDTDSEVVVNLCGNEVTTTDNVVEITTPSEIDDKLIFYGDGIEISNVRLLEGSLNEDSVPRETFEGLKNSFEDGYIPNSIPIEFSHLESGNINSTTGATMNNPDIVRTPLLTVTSDKITLVIVNANYTLHKVILYDSEGNFVTGDTELIDGMKLGVVTVSEGCSQFRLCLRASDVSVINQSNLFILEGDCSHLTLTEEDLNNLGKYKVEYKVTGKNKFDGEYWNNLITINNASTPNGYYGYLIQLEPNTRYTISITPKNINEIGTHYSYITNRSANNVLWLSEKGQPLINKSHIISTDSTGLLILRAASIDNFQDCKDLNLQIEEGSTATEYEPYKEQIKTFYLNSPLLEGDTIEDVNGVATHVKRYGKVVLDGSDDEFWNYYKDMSNGNTFNAYINKDDVMYDQIPICSTLSSGYYDGEDTEKCSIGGSPHIQFQIDKSKLSTSDLEGVKEWFKNNPTTVVYQLASPIYEPLGAYGKVVLDGREDWRGYSTGSTTMVFCSRVLTSDMSNPSKDVICDRFTTHQTAYDYTLGFDCIDLDGGIGLTIQILKSKLPTQDVNGFKQWLSENPTTVIYELLQPQYQGSILCDSYVNGHLDFDSTVPVEKVYFMGTYLPRLKYLNPSTNYTLQFESDNPGKIDAVYCNMNHGGFDVKKGVNKFNFTTPSTLSVGPYVDLYGIGFNASNIQVVATDENVEFDYFKGLKSSFEDGYIPENELVDFPTDIYLNGTSFQQGNGDGCNVYFHTVSLKMNTVYTVFCKINEETTCTNGLGLRLVTEVGDKQYDIITGNLTAMKGIFCSTFTFTNTLRETDNLEIWNRDNGVVSISNMTILEGDWTHLTEEDFNHLGQYKVEYKVTGKNKFDSNTLIKQTSVIIEDGTISRNLDRCTTGFIKVKPNTTYTKRNLDGFQNVWTTFYDVNKNYLGEDLTRVTLYNNTFITPSNAYYTRHSIQKQSMTDEEFLFIRENWQLEEGTQVTSYEPYKEYTKTFYLNSPLLEGDTIEDVNGVATHVKRWKQLSYEDIVPLNLNHLQEYDVIIISNTSDISPTGWNEKVCISTSTFEYNTPGGVPWLALSKASNYGITDWDSALNYMKQQKVVYKLAEPYYEEIEPEYIPESLEVPTFNTVTYITNNSCISPKTTISSKYYNTIIRPSTQYTLIIDNVAGAITVDLGGTIGLMSTDTLLITTPSTLVHDKLKLYGAGNRISNVRLLEGDCTESYPDYFEGMQSSFEDCIVLDETDDNHGRYKVEVITTKAPFKFGKGGEYK